MKKEYIAGIIVVVLFIGGGIFALQKKQGATPKENAGTGTVPAEQVQPQQQQQETVTGSVKNETSTSEKQAAVKPEGKPAVQQPAERKKQEEKPQPAPALSQKVPKDMTQDELLAVLRETGKSEQYVKFTDVLLEVYTRKLEGKDDFKKAESAAYVKASDYLDTEKNPQKALDTADIVYKKVPFGWRFKYLRVRALEALGRRAFDAGDSVKAENYVHTMLQMEFRPEGANLLGDIFIKKMEMALAKGDTKTAREAYEEIKDYEVSTDRATKLAELAKKL